VAFVEPDPSSRAFANRDGPVYDVIEQSESGVSHVAVTNDDDRYLCIAPASWGQLTSWLCCEDRARPQDDGLSGGGIFRPRVGEKS